MRGQTKIYWLIGMLAVILITVILFLKEFQVIVTNTLNVLGKTSSDVVCSQLSNLITISGAAPYEIEINYIPSKAVSYNTTIESRVLTVKLNSQATYLIKLSAFHSFAVNLPDLKYTNVNSFKIEKKIVDGEAKYGFYAAKA